MKLSKRVLPLLAILLLCAASAPLSSQASSMLRGKRLYVDPNSPAARQAEAWKRSRPADAARMRVIAEQPQVIWLGEWLRDVRGESNAMVSRITAARAIPVFAIYNIPHRDCGLHSAGGARGADQYRRWVIDFVRGTNGRPTVVILEPDGIASIDCLPARIRDERYVLLQYTVETFKKAGIAVYIDAGNANWQQPEEMADRLVKAGIAMADGFALNVSNFHATSVNIAYGERLSRMVGGKHFVIDTSRNGREARLEKEWCNAPNQALGRAPTTDTKHPLVDAFLWVKTPGQSDGTCNGGPRAGEWWADYALELSKAAESIGSMFPR